MRSNTLHDQLDAQFTPAWRPQPGDKLVGTVIGLGERAGAYGTYPIVTVRQDDGTELAFHAFHTVAQQQLAEVRPRLGEQIWVKYQGQRGADRTYHSYAVKVDRDESASFNWGRYADGADPTIPSDIPANTPPTATGDDDLPF